MTPAGPRMQLSPAVSGYLSLCPTVRWRCSWVNSDRGKFSARSGGYVTGRVQQASWRWNERVVSPFQPKTSCKCFENPRNCRWRCFAYWPAAYTRPIGSWPDMRPIRRRAFQEVYRRLTAGAKRRRASVVLLVIDVLHLKDINDRFGYSVGNDVLRTVADALIESSRSSDLVARHGGDEFALLLIEAAANDAELVINRVQQKLRQLAIYRNLPLTIEC